jgi:hypothetical protein
MNPSSEFFITYQSKSRKVDYARKSCGFVNLIYAQSSDNYLLFDKRNAVPKTKAKREWRRLYQECESQASQYHDLTLSVDFLTPDHPAIESYEEPNHAIPLWQYVGNGEHDFHIEEFLKAESTNYGHPHAIVIAYGIIAGAQTNLFKKMAARAGSLIPKEVRDEINVRIVRNFPAPEVPGKPVFVGNTNALAVWLNFVLTIIATFQPERFQGRTLPVDPFAASLVAVDFLLNYERDQQSAEDVLDMTEFTSRKFKVALSFPGEKREYVSKIAEGLLDRLGEDSVFYDEYYKAELARPNLDTLIQKIYHENSDLIVVFICKEYEQKQWCGLEWRAIRDLIKKRLDERIMFMRFDDSEVSGSFSIDGYIDLRGQSPEEATDLICRRLGK